MRKARYSNAFVQNTPINFGKAFAACRDQL